MTDTELETATLEAFAQDAEAIARRLGESGAPLSITVAGRPALVVQDAGAYRKLVELASRAEMRTFLDESMADIAAGRVIPAIEFLESLGTKQHKRA